MMLGAPPRAKMGSPKVTIAVVVAAIASNDFKEFLMLILTGIGSGHSQTKPAVPQIRWISAS
jgi:hypothetical protein